ncbi:MAG: PIN domain-containing protein [Microlunatus sp.]
MTTESVYLLDANVLIALANSNHVHHASAHRWFASIDRWATTPITEAAFVRLQSNPVVTGSEISCASALGALAAMRQHPGHVFLGDESSLANPSINLTSLVGFRQVTDFHLVNLCAAQGGVLATFDAKIRNALAAADRRLVEVVPA